MAIRTMPCKNCALFDLNKIVHYSITQLQLTVSYTVCYAFICHWVLLLHIYSFHAELKNKCQVHEAL